MFEFTKGQERVFKIFDELIDNDIDLWEEVQRNEALRKRINRNFESIEGRSKTETALYLYGFDDYVGIPNILELKRCWKISDNGVVLDKLHFNYLKALYNITDAELFRLVNIHKEEVIDHFISNLVSSGLFDDYSLDAIRNMSPKTYRMIYTKYCNSFNFYFAFGIDFKIVYYTRSSKHNFFFALGLMFESLVKKYVFPNENYQVIIKDCIPDFVINGRWVDVKLSKSTVLTDGTIEKYFNHVNKLTIIYAVEDNSDVSFYADNGFIEFIHISEFYKNLSKFEIQEFEEIIECAKVLKGLMAIENR